MMQVAKVDRAGALYLNEILIFDVFKMALNISNGKIC